MDTKVETIEALYSGKSLYALKNPVVIIYDDPGSTEPKQKKRRSAFPTKYAVVSRGPVPFRVFTDCLEDPILYWIYCRHKKVLLDNALFSDEAAILRNTRTRHPFSLTKGPFGGYDEKISTREFEDYVGGVSNAQRMFRLFKDCHGNNRVEQFRKRAESAGYNKNEIDAMILIASS